jgi:inhibitor of cysteine peptidase
MNLRLRVLAALGISILAVVGCQKGNQAGGTKEVASKEVAGGAKEGEAGSKAHPSDERPAEAGDVRHDAGSARAASTLTEVDNERVIALRQGQTVVVVLASNRSTGLRWTLVDSTTNVVVRDGAPAYSPPAGKRDNGTETWRFRSVKPGEQTMRLEYRREWAQHVPERTFRFTAVVH